MNIAIIGGRGRMGRMFVKIFRKQGHRVLVVGRKTKTTPVMAAKTADCVIITVPIRNTAAMIRKVAPHMSKHALLTDFTSVKTFACREMRKAQCNVIGGHPVFGPVKKVKGQYFVLCPVKGSYVWYAKALKKAGLKVMIMTPQQHDWHMAVSQCLTQLGNFAFVLTLKQLRYKGDKLSSPGLRLKQLIIKRALAADSSLYTDIEVCNPYAKKMATLLSKNVRTLQAAMNNPATFEKLIRQCQKHMGKPTRQEQDLISRLL